MLGRTAARTGGRSRGAAGPVVTTIFPLYDWARAVGGDRVTVTQLLPPGVEAHSYAPKPSDVFGLNRADVFIYLGEDLEPWAEDLLRGAENPRLAVIEAGHGVARDGEHEGGQDHAHHGTDPHIWLDPLWRRPSSRPSLKAWRGRIPRVAKSTWPTPPPTKPRCRPFTSASRPVWAAAGTGRFCTAAISRSATSRDAMG